MKVEERKDLYLDVAHRNRDVWRVCENHRSIGKYVVQVTGRFDDIKVQHKGRYVDLGQSCEKLNKMVFKRENVMQRFKLILLFNHYCIVRRLIAGDQVTFIDEELLKGVNA